MPLMMLDLDNTLIDRDAAFRSAAVDFLAARELPTDDLARLLEADASGYAPRETLAAAIAARYPNEVTIEEARALTDFGAAERAVPAESTGHALAAARRAGWKLVIVTNGQGPQQLAKIRNTGLDALVDAWIISGDIGLQKPDPRVFTVAAEAVEQPLDGAWMIGDSPQHDIAGARASALQSVWITTTTKSWTEREYRPTHVAQDVAAAIRYVVAQRT